MQIHASCVALDGIGVILLGPSGSGKSDLALRLLDRGFMLVADDRVEITNGTARPPAPLAGLLEVRGMGIFHFPHLAAAQLALAVDLGAPAPRLPESASHPALDLPMIALDPWHSSAAQRVALALACLQGRIVQHSGAFAV